MDEFDSAINEIYDKWNDNIISDILSRKDNKEVIMFGAGELGHKVYHVLANRGIQIHYFCDNFLKGKLDERTGLKIVGMEELPVEREGLLILIAIFDEKTYEIIRHSLLESGFSREQLINTKKLGDIISLSHLKKNIENYRRVYSFLADDFSRQVYLKRMQRAYLDIDISSVVSKGVEEYFDEQIILTEEETFVDCGGYVGDTSLKFINRTKGRYKDIIIFEPERCKIEEIRKNMADYKYSLYKYGVWNCSEVLRFDEKGNVGSCISEKGGVEIETCALDDVVYEKVPTFIKMDIEGAEIKALLGSTKIIRDFRPKLAICIYHKPDDLFEIPMLIRELCKDYKIFIRQYSNSRYETVCYAV